MYIPTQYFNGRQSISEIYFISAPAPGFEPEPRHCKLAHTLVVGHITEITTIDKLRSTMNLFCSVRTKQYHASRSPFPRRSEKYQSEVV